MPLTRTQKANLLGGIGTDFARAFNPNIQPWRNIEEPKLGNPKLPTAEYLKANAPVNVTTQKPFARPMDTTTPELLWNQGVKDVTQTMPRYQAEAEHQTWKEQQERTSKALDIDTRNKVSNYFQTQAVMVSEDSPWNGIYQISAVFAQDPDIKADDLFKRVIELKKGYKEDIDQFADYFQGLKDYAGIEMNNPEHMQQLLTPGSPMYNEAKGLMVMLKKDVIKTENEATGKTELHQLLSGNRAVKIAEFQTKKPFAQERKEKAILAEDEAIIQKKYREPREPKETRAEKLVVARDIELMKRGLPEKPLTVAQKNQRSIDLARASESVIKYKKDYDTGRGYAAAYNDISEANEYYWNGNEWTLRPKQSSKKAQPSKGYTFKNDQLIPNR